VGKDKEKERWGKGKSDKNKEGYKGKMRHTSHDI
jgi:hypothetical protein